MNGYGPKIRPPTPSTKKSTYTYNKNRTTYTYKIRPPTPSTTKKTTYTYKIRPPTPTHIENS